eukprot:TRINITY_DN645_c0_g5_i1.p1 TRINITY_DN645_c0_g5~~TRINITY_DN645_c0_g5_i1.p1  ORF type:complete len:649 (-),score=164.41 TRINITY_DN645_c0_g5_i1:183-2129(-)
MATARLFGPSWVDDDAVEKCELCDAPFSFFVRKHHCRACGHIFCSTCSAYEMMLQIGPDPPAMLRACYTCFTSDAQRKTTKVSVEDTSLLAQNFLRGTSYTFKEALQNVGWRSIQSKSYFLVIDNAIELLMTMNSSKAAPVPLNNPTTKKMFTDILRSLVHPYIIPIDYVAYFEARESVVVLRKLREKGSLRDMLHLNKNPKEEYKKKYVKKARPFDLKIIAKAARQILEALLYLKTQKVGHYHLHAGNILIKDGNCCLSDIENNFIGLPNRMTLWSDKLAPEVESFGYVLFEISMGFEFDTTNGKTKEEVFDNLLKRTVERKCYPEVMTILHQIFFEAPTSIANTSNNNATTTPTTDATNGSQHNDTNGTATDGTTASSPSPSPTPNVPSVEDLLALPLFSSLGLQQPLPQQRQTSVKERKYLKAVKKGARAISIKVKEKTIDHYNQRAQKQALLEREKEKAGASGPVPGSRSQPIKGSGFSLICSFESSSPPQSPIAHSSSAPNLMSSATINPLSSTTPTPTGGGSQITPKKRTTKKKKTRSSTLKQPVSSSSSSPALSSPTPPPPPPAPKATSKPGGPPPPPPPPGPTPPPATGGRKNLLSSIEGFSKNGLKKTVTVDKSGPLLSSSKSNGAMSAMFNSPMLNKF